MQAHSATTLSRQAPPARVALPALALSAVAASALAGRLAASARAARLGLSALLAAGIALGGFGVAPARAAAPKVLYPEARLRHAGPSVVAIDGDTLVVASARNASPNGSVGVYARGQDGWQQQAVLRSHGLPQDGGFGTSVAISGDTVVVGAPPYSVYVFVRRPAGWLVEEQVPAPQSEASPDFGTSVAVSGNRLLVGGPTLAFSQNVGGTAFAYQRVGGAWRFDGTFFDAADDSYGFRVGLAGDLAVIGTTLGDTLDVFLRQPQGWTRQQAVPVGANNASYFSLSGDTVAAGGHVEPLQIWQLSDGAWTQQAALPIASTVLSLDGDQLAAALPDGGGVQIYRRQGRAGAWLFVTTLEEPRADPVSGFGNSVALSAGIAAVSSNNPVWIFAPSSSPTRD